MMPRCRLRLAHAACCALLLLASCHTFVRQPFADSAGISVVRVYDMGASRWVTFETMAHAIAKADIVFFGEQHDDPVTHSVELAVLAALGERRGRVMLSLEMFERDVQPVLDRYLSGALSERDFLAGARPWDRYVTDYRPLVELARVRGWPVVAANVPRRVASAVSRRGLALLDTLNAAERAFAAREHSCPHDRYYEKFVGTMGTHNAGSGPPTAADAASALVITERFYEAQCVKDEAMGEAVAAAFMRGGRRTPVLHVDGAFHSDYKLGTAERVRRRVPSAKIVVLSAVPVASLAAANAPASRDRGDYIVFTLAAVKP